MQLPKSSGRVSKHLIIRLIYSVHFDQGTQASYKGVSNLLTCGYLLFNWTTQARSGREEQSNSSASVSNIPTFQFFYMQM